MLIKNERSANPMPPLRDCDNNFNLAYDCFEKAGILNRHFCSVSDLNDRNKDPLLKLGVKMFSRK
jgi:hypothetical protein